jgi:hypothetical protein
MADMLVRIASELDDSGLKELEESVQRAGGELQDMGNKGEAAGEATEQGARGADEAIKAKTKSVTAFLAKAAGVVLLFNKIFNATRTQVQAELQLQAAIENTTSAVDRQGRTVSQVYKEYEAFAQERQKSIGIGDEETLAFMAQAQMMGIASRDMIEFTRTAQNQAQATGRSLDGVGRQLARVYQEPLKNMRLLERAGIRLNETMMESMSIEEQRAYVLAELNERFEGQAEAVKLANFGFDDLKNTVGDAFEEIGRIVLPVLGAIIKPLTSLIGLFNEAPPIIRTLILAVGAAVPVIMSLGSAFAFTLGPVGWIAAGIAGISALISLFSSANTQMQDMIDKTAELSAQTRELTDDVRKLSDVDIRVSALMDGLTQLKEGTEEYEQHVSNLLSMYPKLRNANITVSSSYNDIREAVSALRREEANRAAAAVRNHIQEVQRQSMMLDFAQRTLKARLAEAEEYERRTRGFTGAIGEAQARQARENVARLRGELNSMQRETTDLANEMRQLAVETGNFLVQSGEDHKKVVERMVAEFRDVFARAGIARGLTGEQLRAFIQRNIEFVENNIREMQKTAEKNPVVVQVEVEEPDSRQLEKDLAEPIIDTLAEVSSAWQNMMSIANGNIAQGVSGLFSQASQLFKSPALGWVGFGISAIGDLFSLFRKSAEEEVDRMEQLLSDIKIGINIAQLRGSIAAAIYGGESTQAIQENISEADAIIDGYRKFLQAKGFKSGLTDEEVLLIMHLIASGDIEGLRPFIETPPSDPDRITMAPAGLISEVLYQLQRDLERVLEQTEAGAEAFRDRFTNIIQLAAKDALDALRMIDYELGTGQISEGEALERQIAAYDTMISDWQEILELMPEGIEYAAMREEIEWAIRDAQREQYQIQQALLDLNKENNDELSKYADTSEKLARMLKERENILMDLEAGKRVMDRETAALLSGLESGIVGELQRLGADRDVWHEFERAMFDRATGVFGAGLTGAGISAGFDPATMLTGATTSTTTQYGDIIIDGMSMGNAGQGFYEGLLQYFAEQGVQIG